ncbi:MAG: serine hydrolase [Planctomycetaceae bacterium]|nr:serine hydrolase [Planctomycetaceae bacterium]
MRRLISRGLLAIVLLTRLSASTLDAAEPLADLKPKIDALVAPLIDNKAIVGLVVGIRRGDEEVFLSYGTVGPGKEAAPTRETIYEIGSITKAFTGVLLADESLRHGLDLNIPVVDALPAGAPKPEKPGEKPIKLAHLATHTSGLPRLPADLRAKDVTNPYADFTAEDAYAFFAKHQPKRDPGEYEYSNYAMGLLGQILADRAGKSYDDLVQERICGPLGMTETRQALTPAMKSRLAPPHDGDLQRGKNWDFDALVGAGGLRSNARDMLKFAAAMLADDDRDVTKAFKLAGEPREKIPGGLGIGLAWHLARDGITRLHDGQTGGYSSFVACIPENKLAVVVLGNTAVHQFTSQVGEKAAQLALGMKVEPVKVRQIVDIPVETLQKYVGSYSLNFFMKFTVTLDGDRLKVKLTGQDAFPIYPSSPTEFFYRIVDAQITFVLDDKGEVTKLILHQNGVDQEAPRQK